MTYQEAKEVNKRIEEKVNILSAKLNSYPKGLMGMTREDIRLSDEYQAVKREYSKAFKELQDFNKWFLKTFKKEYAKERRERYMLKCK